ncbi:hypothetical protein B0J18DRAFT_151489 [Chaetomium sp. MPI-SDFR-AT-0129]|nr:hypothetical protein B0J18DRAFT_151489 [Chaetomium sp. MPI-SDFR-AT-0129]
MNRHYATPCLVLRTTGPQSLHSSTIFSPPSRKSENEAGDWATQPFFSHRGASQFISCGSRVHDKCELRLLLGRLNTRAARNTTPCIDPSFRVRGRDVVRPETTPVHIGNGGRVMSPTVNENIVVTEGDPRLTLPAGGRRFVSGLEDGPRWRPKESIKKRSFVHPPAICLAITRLSQNDLLGVGRLKYRFSSLAQRKRVTIPIYPVHS